MPPFFTIITSTYNAASTLPRLLDSLASQTCRDFNWIVQDGASSDATMQIVEQYRDHLPEILAESSKDNGIYDAWNKAITRWQDNLGEWVLFLGGDDKLLNNTTLESVKNKISSFGEDVFFAAGDVSIVDENGNVVAYKIIDNNQTKFQQIKFKIPICHSSLFTRKKILLQYKFNSSFKISGDYDFLIRTWKKYEQMLPIHCIVTQMAVGGISSNEYYRNLHIREQLKIFIKIKSIRGIIGCIDAFFYKFKAHTKKILLKTYIGCLFWNILQKIHNRILPQ